MTKYFNKKTMGKNQLTCTSPNQEHTLDFVFHGEIKFGPSYFMLSFDGNIIVDRTFGLEYIWHPEDKYLAIQEWLTIDYQKGPITVLTILNLKTMESAKISIIEKGFISPLKFEDDIIVFKKDYTGKGRIVELEINCLEIKNWEAILIKPKHNN